MTQYHHSFLIISFVCASVAFEQTTWPEDSCWTGVEDPIVEYVPYYNLNINPLGSSVLFDGQLFRSTVTTSRFEDSPLISPGIHVPLWKALNGFGKYTGAPAETALVYARNALPGSLIVPHQHQNTELSCVFQGTARVTVTSSFRPPHMGKRRKKQNLRRASSHKTSSLEDYETTSKSFLLHGGECFYIPTGYTHYFHNVGTEELHILNTFNYGNINKGTDRIQDIVRGFPLDLVADTLQVEADTVANFELLDIGYHPPYPGWTIQEGQAGASEMSRYKMSFLSEVLVPAPRCDIHGDVRTKLIDANVNPILEQAQMAVAYTEIAPGARMEPYWVENADEVILVQQGSNLEVVRSEKWQDCRDTFVAETEYYILHEQGTLMSITNNGTMTAKLYRFFNSNRPTANTLHDWYHKLPEDVRKSIFYPNQETSG